MWPSNWKVLVTPALLYPILQKREKFGIWVFSKVTLSPQVTYKEKASTVKTLIYIHCVLKCCRFTASIRSFRVGQIHAPPPRTQWFLPLACMSCSDLHKGKRKYSMLRGVLKVWNPCSGLGAVQRWCFKARVAWGGPVIFFTCMNLEWVSIHDNMLPCSSKNNTA